MTDTSENGQPDIGLLLHMSEGDHLLQAALVQQEGRDLPDIESIKQAINDAGYAELLLDESALTRLLAKPGAADTEPEYITIAERRDAEITVTTSDHEMMASVSVKPAYGGKPVTRASLEKALQEADIYYGLLEDKFAPIIAAGKADNEVIARGTEPVDGEDTKFIPLVETSRILRPEINKKGKADYHALGDVICVAPGDKLLQRVPPTPGTPGKNVFGEPLAQQPGKDEGFFPKLFGAGRDPNDSNILIATAPGSPVYTDSGVDVEPVYAVNNVDLTVGNITFDGTVNVKGDVRNGMTIKATGDIVIKGTVESARLEAGGGIIVEGGIIGRHEKDADIHKTEDFAAHIIAEKSIAARFAENAFLQSSDDIFIGELMSHCHATAKKSVYVGTTNSKRGNIIGGITCADEDIHAMVLGSPASIHTYLFPGYSYPDVKKDIAETEHHIEDQNIILDKIITVTTQLRNSQDESRKAVLEKANENLNKIKADLFKLKEHLNQQEQQLVTLGKTSIIVSQRIFNNVGVTIGGDTYTTTDEGPAGKFRLDEGKVILSY